MSLTKLDLHRQLRPYYHPRGVELVQVPPMKYITVRGEGRPGGESFREAMGVIFDVAYTLKFRVRKRLKKDYAIMAPEGLWWTKSGGKSPRDPDDWFWTLMVVVPDFVNGRMFSDSVKEVKAKKNPPGLDRARLETFDEGFCVQTLHVGPYSTEPESMAKMEAYARKRGYVMMGRHHEIYLGDPNRATPSRLKTVIRRPVAEVP